MKSSEIAHKTERLFQLIEMEMDLSKLTADELKMVLESAAAILTSRINTGFVAQLQAKALRGQ